MRVYWYWPFSREENLPLAHQVGQHAAVDELVVSTIARPGAWSEGGPATTIKTDLPGVRPSTGLAWALNRTSVYLRRAVVRHRTISAVDPHLVHLWYSNLWTDPLDVRLLRKRPTLLHVHDVWPHARRLPAKFTRWQLRAMYSAPSALLVHHESLRSALVERFGIDPDRVSVIPHVVPRPHDCSEDHDRPDETVVAFFGTFRSYKGLDVLVDAIRRLGPMEGVRWVIVGRGESDLENVVRQLAAERDDVEARIGWSTAVEKSRLYSEADLVLLPYTKFASQSGVLHDAYGHGRAVLVTDVGALGPSVREDGTGWVVAPGDVVALTEGIERAISDRRGRSRFASAARARAMERTPERVADALIEVYRRVVS